MRRGFPNFSLDPPSGRPHHVLHSHPQDLPCVSHSSSPPWRPPLPPHKTSPTRPGRPGPPPPASSSPTAGTSPRPASTWSPTDLPLNLLPLKDGKHVLVATSGYNKHELSPDRPRRDRAKVVASETARQSWYGLALDRAEGKVWWSGGGATRLHTFDLKDGKLTRTSPLDAEPKKETPAAKKEAKEAPKPFPSGLCLDEARG